VDQCKTDYHITFGTEHGQRVLQDILEYCHVMEPGDITQGAEVLIFKEGRRDVATFILERLQAKRLMPDYE